MSAPAHASKTRENPVFTPKGGDLKGAAPDRSPFTRIRPGIAKLARWRYRSPVAANSATGRENPSIKLAHKRPHTVEGAFFVPADMLYGGCAWAGFGLAGCQLARFLTPRTVRHHLPRENGGDGSEPQVGAVPMHHIPALNPSALRDRAAAHRAMALAALRADSSLSVRLKRYNAAMAKARALEAEAARLGNIVTSAPSAALAWLQSGKPVRIDAANLRDHLRHVRALVEVQGGAQ